MRRTRHREASSHGGARKSTEPALVRRARHSRQRSALVIASVGVLAGSGLLLSSPLHNVYRTVAGEGHGRGMSQVGAFDSAKDGVNAEGILAHYYPGAALATVPDVPIRVRLGDQDDATLDTFADAGAFVAGEQLEPGQVAHLTPRPDGGADVVVTAGCDGDQLWQATTDDPWVHPIDDGTLRPAGENLRLCDGPAYRGALGVALEDGRFRTVNEVRVEDYLLGVVPAEVQANWADKGAAEALRAQAIAARSYALAEDRYEYAQTCDSTDCQNYPGTEKEDPRSADAVAATAGTVLMRDGRVLRSEYSSAPDGGHPADITTFEVGPSADELGAIAPDPAGQVETGRAADENDQGAGTESAIDVEYRRIGGADSSIGNPIGPESALPQRAGTYRRYENGVIVNTKVLGARVVDYNQLLSLIPGQELGEGQDQSSFEGASPGEQDPTVPEQQAIPDSESVAPPQSSTPNESSLTEPDQTEPDQTSPDQSEPSAPDAAPDPTSPAAE